MSGRRRSSANRKRDRPSTPRRWVPPMSKSDFTFRIGGAAGDGVSSTAESFARICSRSGLHVWTYSSYQSVIRGGHVWTQVRAGADPLLSHGEDPEVLVALNQATLDVHEGGVAEGGVILYDSEALKVDPSKHRPRVRALGIPLRRLAQTLSPNAVMRNTVALGAAVRLLDLDFRHVETAFKGIWGSKKPEVVAQNVQAARLGANEVQDHGGSPRLGIPYTNVPRPLMTGNEAVCLGALAAGCKFLAQYPMTPASSIMHWMAAHGPAHGVVVKQVEDELAAINMAIGAGFAGARAMTATSGGGFCLMVEALGQGGMTETPVVAVLVQRAGPSTGVPTKTEQGDLNLVLGAGQGDWPRAIIAPRDTVECFRSIVKAFNLPILRGFLADGNGGGKDYKRFQFTENGISPRAFPGMKGFQFTAGTDEHMESGVLISDVLAGVPPWVEERRKMMEKRMRKLEGLRRELRPPELWGPADAELTIVSWGSTQGAVREAIGRLNGAGHRVNSLEFFDLFPFKVEEAQELLEGAKRTLCVEGNYTGQFARLLRAETGYKVDELLAQYDGEPIEPREVVARALQG